MLPLDHSYFFGLIFLEIMWIPVVIDCIERHASQISGSYLRGSKFQDREVLGECVRDHQDGGDLDGRGNSIRTSVVIPKLICC